ncbi:MULTISPECIES: pyrimidine-specific ribonucleoside hydrolase RihA [Shewanella]|uniref:Pyrimidine-specific ribonucleoside hydrolase RihA n=1 Tax=Shewanella fidelis TaxID=173509 RepID=A0AAW8NN61_9GAMM|nr:MULTISPECIES: pyrimidine-specific ribonucleoside hydrolase RihA [Shewanella]MDR8523616.1 pyrimidine-specific ribonucleoside hydrolase RihA [Shewanella fidelis]MDW4810163.1 pyrimidine-specific ribonucleoside hydrolase RihA [Shewanella fidelis]MDW4814308.1 pyrimidine-specific ribonucleoside hydrolase RihA [Shewanella fidelis]MDW4818399.1 pyrimidine-specific ribonucleoside hydrolase RihA [Shewanella fidelis]MDW4823949.1 pyrimidine-specific ribonucleoside hydrolase RihA [Shewanella fidelis]
MSPTTLTTAKPIILDCDPGHDDAISLILAMSSKALKPLAVTTSAGNQTPDKTLNNALRILTLLERHDIPVAAGAPKPLARELIIADNVHGESGLDGPKLPDPAFEPLAISGIELMAQKVRESDEPVTLVPSGPLTNIALFLSTYPELHCKVERIVLMGGAAEAGNWTPAAEFNIFVDPEAADIVYKSGIPITMCGLDITHQAQIMDEDIERIRVIPNPVAKCVAELLDFFMIYHRDPKWGFEGAPLHDPCTIAWLLKPELFSSYDCWVGVETKGEYTQGMTVVDRYQLTNNPHNTQVLCKLDRQGFVDLIVECLEAYN